MEAALIQTLTGRSLRNREKAFGSLNMLRLSKPKALGHKETSHFSLALGILFAK